MTAKAKVDGYQKFIETTSKNLTTISTVTDRAKHQLNELVAIREQAESLKEQGEDPLFMAVNPIHEIGEELKHLADLLNSMIEINQFFEDSFNKEIHRRKGETCTVER